MDIIAFYHSAANSVNFSAYVLRVLHGLDTTLETNCGRPADGSTVPTSHLSEEWGNKGISILAVTGAYLNILFYFLCSPWCESRGRRANHTRFHAVLNEKWYA